MKPLALSLPLVAALLAPLAAAHFPFVVPEAGFQSAKLVMSETLEPDLEVDIELLAKATLSLRDAHGRVVSLALKPGANCKLLELPGDGTRVVFGKADLGVMKRGKPHWLVYYPKTIVGDGFDRSCDLAADVPIELRPLRAEGGFRLELRVDGRPATEAAVRVILPDGSETDYPTDAEGRTAIFPTNGRYAAWARNWVDQPGTLEGQSYEQVRRYATLVFDAQDQPSVADDAQLERRGTPRGALPQAVASFGAVECGGWLYVYGGHVADRHDYSVDSISGRFHRMDLRSPGKWEELAGGVHAQGLNLATHGGKVYRAGGMEPRNRSGEPSDQHSLAEVACFDPAKGAWSNLPLLPRPRSSHDVVVVGNQLMVVGGWWMKGRGTETQWLDTVDVLDLSASAPAWRSVPQPFTRRALIAGVVGDDVFVIGGFDADEMAQSEVDVFDTSSSTWSKGPPIPGNDGSGFGPAACAHDGELYVSIDTGEMFRLSRDRSAWEPFAHTTPRIVHRMVPFAGEILVLGGAAERRMLDLIEAVDVRTAVESALKR